MRRVLSLLLVLAWFLVNPLTALAATLSLDPASSTVNKGCTFAVDINLNTQNAVTDGTDVILMYDPAVLSVTSISNGTIYDDYPGNSIDSQNGKISIHALSDLDKGFSGTGTLATVNFQISSTTSLTSTTLAFDFDPNNKTKTTDSNVIEKTKLTELLSSVTDGAYTVSSGTCGSTTKAAASPVPTVAARGGGIDQLPASGTLETTLAVFGVGSLLALLGILGLKSKHK